MQLKLTQPYQRHAKEGLTKQFVFKSKDLY